MLRGLTYPRLTRLFLLGRRFIPGPLRAHVRRFMFESLDLRWTLPTGLHVCAAHYGDWVVYNEVFVSGEYDAALQRLVETTHGGPVHVADLGANTGFFTLRVIDRLRAAAAQPTDIAITAVEGHPECIRVFKARVMDENGLSGCVRIVHGLVGRRTGSGVLHTDPTQPASSTVVAPSGKGGRGLAVPYVDLSAVFESTPVIHLLKCDIEGAEEAFLETYPDVLAKVQLAVFEFHRTLCDVDRCLAMLRTYGFTHQVIYRDGAQHFTCGVWR
jgi:FkbM family methyltransferase